MPVTVPSTLPIGTGTPFLSNVAVKSRMLDR